MQHCLSAFTASYLQVLGAFSAVLHSPALLQRRTEVCRYCFLLLVQVTVDFLQPCQKLAPPNRCSIWILRGGHQVRASWKPGLGSVPLVSAKPASPSAP